MKTKRGQAWYRNIGFGSQIGTNLSAIDITTASYQKVFFLQRESTHTGNILWFTAGATVEYFFLKQLGVTVGVLYGRTGMYWPNNNIKVKQERMLVPVTLTYCTGQRGTGVQLQLGLQPSFALATTYYELTGSKDEELDEATYESEEDVPNKFKVQVLDLAWVGAVAYRFTNGLEIGIRISKGLLDCRDEEAKHDSQDSEEETWRSINYCGYMGYNLAQLFKSIY